MMTYEGLKATRVCEIKVKCFKMIVIASTDKQNVSIVTNN